MLDRQTYSVQDRQRGRQRDRQRVREINRETENRTDCERRQSDRLRDKKTVPYTDRQRYSFLYRQTVCRDRQTYIETDI